MVRLRFSLYRLKSDLTENTCHVSECVFIGQLPSTGHGVDHTENTSSIVRMRVYWRDVQHLAWCGPHRKYPFYCCVCVFRALLTNGSTYHSIELFFFWHYSRNLGLGLPPLNSPFHFGFLDDKTVGRTPWAGDQLVAGPLPVYKHRKTRARIHTQTHKH
jgi:hypothetical protein